MLKLAALPGETQVYCGHEYTEANARFALTIEPDNAVLKDRVEEIMALRAAGKPTVPTTIAAGTRDQSVPARRAGRRSRPRSAWRAPTRRAVFAEIRTRKDSF